MDRIRVFETPDSGSIPLRRSKFLCLGSLMVERHPYTVDTGVQFSNEVPSFSVYNVSPVDGLVWN